MAQRSPHVQANRLRRASFALVCLLCLRPAWPNVDIEVRGVDDELRANVLAYLSFDRYRKSESLSADTIERLHNRVEREVAAALKPFGYYEPKTRSQLEDLGVEGVLGVAHTFISGKAPRSIAHPPAASKRGGIGGFRRSEGAGRPGDGFASSR